MKVKIFRIDKTLPLPQYHTPGAAAFDLYSRIDASVPPKKPVQLPSNLIIEVPKDHFLLIAARSSTAKKGLMLSNGIGVVDQDYFGPTDEIGLLVYNFTDKKVIVKRGERIAQGLIMPVARAEWKEVGNVKKTSRGGFGSTG